MNDEDQINDGVEAEDAPDDDNLGDGAKSKDSFFGGANTL
jgi:hypothetical protein